MPHQIFFLNWRRERIKKRSGLGLQSAAARATTPFMREKGAPIALALITSSQVVEENQNNHPNALFLFFEKKEDYPQPQCIGSYVLYISVFHLISLAIMFASQHCGIFVERRKKKKHRETKPYQIKALIILLGKRAKSRISTIIQPSSPYSLIDVPHQHFTNERVLRNKHWECPTI